MFSDNMIVLFIVITLEYFAISLEKHIILLYWDSELIKFLKYQDEYVKALSTLTKFLYLMIRFYLNKELALLKFSFIFTITWMTKTRVLL